MHVIIICQFYFFRCKSTLRSYNYSYRLSFLICPIICLVASIPRSFSYGTSVTSSLPAFSKASLYGTGLSINGMIVLFDCFAALSAIACQRSTFLQPFFHQVLRHNFSLKPERSYIAKFYCLLNDKFHFITFRKSLK